MRQSRGRDESVSPAEQRQRIEEACERDGHELLTVLDEIDVSGGTPLADRAGLLAAIEAVEKGAADLVIVAYFDRLVRSLRVQDEVVGRVERAGGRVLAIDFGEVSGKTAAQWLSGTLIGAVSEYYRRSVGERVAGAQADAVARGVAPYARVPPGYIRGEDRRFHPSGDAPAVREAFRMRAQGEPISAIRRHLKANGIERSTHGVQALLASRVVLGELHFGALANLEAHEAIVDPATWARAQRAKAPPGRPAKSPRLLARLGVLRCGSCGSRLVVASRASGGKRWPSYRCRGDDCPRPMTIAAGVAEGVVVDAVRAAISDELGRASADDAVRSAEAALEAAQDRLDAAIRAFADLSDEPAAVEQLRDLRAARDAASDRLRHLGGPRSALTVTGEDWHRLTLGERRALIRATVERVTVNPGRGAGRLTVQLVGE